MDSSFDVRSGFRGVHGSFHSFYLVEKDPRVRLG